MPRMMRWIHTRDFDLMTKTMDEEMTPTRLISELTALMTGDSIFDEFMEDIEGDLFTHFTEDTADMDEYERTEKADDLLESLYDYADSERIAL
jgi:hypothetical protein